jgi:RNA-binding motif protein, X-linked 2
MNTIKSIQKLNEEELRLGISGTASWHNDYASSAYVNVSGLSYGMNEGDVVTVFSQCGEIVDCNLVRDTETGESKGFAFIGFADQRSTVLAVDNLNGAVICGRTVKVDHVSQYRVPKEFNEESAQVYNPTGPDGTGWGEFKRLSKEQLTKHNQKTQDADVIWEKQLMESMKIERPKEKHKKHKKHRQKKHSEKKKNILTDKVIPN